MAYNLGHVVGPAGKGIQGISKTDTTGLVDTYTITYSDGTTSTFTVTNGESNADVVTEWGSTPSDSKVPSEKLTKESLDDKADSNHTHTGMLTTSDVKDNLTSTDTNKPLSAKQGKELKTLVDAKQPLLVSGTNIKTVNNNSLLGSGNIDIQGGGGGTDVGSFGDLQDLIDEASSGDIIVLDKDYKNAGSESKIDIRKPLTIIGNGHVIDADGKSMIFDIRYSGSISVYTTFTDLIFTNAYHPTGDGGAIYSASSTKFYDCVFNNNLAKTGGALSLNGRYNIISNCRFNNNTATDDESDNIDGANSYFSAIIHNCYVSTGLVNCINYDDLNSENLVTSWSSTVTDTNIASEKLIKDTIDGLSIPTKISDLTNDSDFIETSSTSGLIKNDGTVDTNTYVDTDDIANNLTTTTSDKVLDARQGKILYDLIAGIEEDMLQ